MISRYLLVTFRLPSAALRRTYPALPSRHGFSTTSAPQASENPDSFINSFKNTPIFEKLADKPDALSALATFARLLQQKGVDVSAGRPPSTMQMMKLAANSEFREAAKKVVEEMQKAGVDLNSQEALEQIMNMKKPGDN